MSLAIQRIRGSLSSSAWEGLFPSRCLLCSGDDLVQDGVCVTCRNGIRRLAPPLCDICGQPIGTPGVCLECLSSPPPFDRMLSAGVFEGVLRDVIHGFKYRRRTAFKRFLAGLIHDTIPLLDRSPDILACVPLHWSRMILRGYNQSALIARELSGYLGVDVRYDILRKTRRTPTQVGLKRPIRQRNLRHAFTAREVKGKAVMVVDDVITTGRTAREVSKTLKSAGAAYVIFVSAGRAVS